MAVKLSEKFLSSIKANLFATTKNNPKMEPRGKNFPIKEVQKEEFASFIKDKKKPYERSFHF